ncbi:MAG TPA: hypothetical protein VH601_24335 [Bryobacteraceae bacterium]
MRCSRVLFPVAAIVLSCLASGQSVISVHSGLLNYFDGEVYLDDQPLHDKFGTFPTIKAGSALRTEQGRAEILLTPGVFLRLDQNSSIRMVTVALTDTRVEFLKGSAILDSTESQAGNSPLILYWACEVRFTKPGVYRLDAEPAPLLEVYSGEAEVKHDGGSSLIGTSDEFFFLAATKTNRYGDGNFDPFYDWAKNRNDLIAADNQSAAQSMADPGDTSNGPSLPLGPGIDPGVPAYGSPAPTYGGLGVPAYGGGFGTVFGSAPLYPYGPYGIGINPSGVNSYPFGVIWVVPRYRYPRVHSHWPDRPVAPGVTTVSPGFPSVRAGSPPVRPGLPPVRVGLPPARLGAPPVHSPVPTYRPYTSYRPPVFTPGIANRRFVPMSPAPSRPGTVAAPQIVARPSFAARPMGHR